MIRRVTCGSMALLLLLPAIPMFIVASFANEVFSFNAMPIGSLYMLGLAFTFIPLVLMPSKIQSGKLKALRTVLMVACALFVVITVFASTSPTVLGHVPTSTTTLPHTFTSTTFTYTWPTTTTQCAWTTSFEYYGETYSTECYSIHTGQTVWYSTILSTLVTSTSTLGSTVAPQTTVTYGESIVISPVILEPKTTITYTTSYGSAAYSTSYGVRTYTSTGNIYQETTTSVTLYSPTITTTDTFTTTVWGPQVEYTTVTVTSAAVTVTETTTETPTTVYGYLARDGSTGAIYYIYDAKKYHVLSMAALGLYGFRDGQWKTATAAELAYASGYDLNGYVPLPPNLLANGSLMGDTTTFAIYYVAGGTKYHITTMAAFTGYGFNVADIVWVPSAHTTLYANGADLSGGALPWPA